MLYWYVVCHNFSSAQNYRREPQFDIYKEIDCHGSIDNMPGDKILMYSVVRVVLAVHIDDTSKL